MTSLIGSLLLTILPSQIEAPSLFKALSGPWTGYLEYKDYSGPGRVRIAVLFRFTPSQDGKTAALRFVFDEGPGKTMEDNHTVVLDSDKRTYTMKSSESEEVYRIEGLEKLRTDGTGSVRLLGQGTSNDKPVDVRLTLRISIDRLTMLRETRKGTEPFSFGSVFELRKISQPMKA